MFIFYYFSEGNYVGNLSVPSVLNPDVLSGIFNRPESARIIIFKNRLRVSCNLEINFQPNFYNGNNATHGCPTRTGGKVVLNLTIRETLY